MYLIVIRIIYYIILHIILTATNCVELCRILNILIERLMLIVDVDFYNGQV